jgi:phosphoenolpyruvate carboxylase
MMVRYMRENGKTMIFVVKEIVNGQMVENTKVNGSRTKCMVKADMSLTAKCTKVNTRMGKNMVMEFILGPMVKSMLEIGPTVSNMEKVLTKAEKVNGTKVKESFGRTSVMLWNKLD